MYKKIQWMGLCALLLLGSFLVSDVAFAGKHKGGAVLAKAMFCKIRNGKVVAKKRLPYLVMYGKSPFCNANAHNCYKNGMDYISRGRSKISTGELLKLLAKAAKKTGVACKMAAAQKDYQKCASKVIQSIQKFFTATSYCATGHHAFCAAKYSGWIPCDPSIRGPARVFNGRKTKQCFFFGKAPLCKERASTCKKKGLYFSGYSIRGDGHKCRTGRKVRCCNYRRPYTRRCSTLYRFYHQGSVIAKKRTSSLGQCRNACLRMTFPYCMGYNYKSKGKNKGLCILQQVAVRPRSHKEFVSGVCK